MTRLILVAAAIAGALLPAALPAAAQTRAHYAIDPSQSLSAQPTSPLQQQIQQDYRSNLMSAQRDLLQSNPSGLGREQIAIGHLLDMPPH